jgi:hypothetical protein
MRGIRVRPRKNRAGHIFAKGFDSGRQRDKVESEIIRGGTIVYGHVFRNLIGECEGHVLTRRGACRIHVEVGDLETGRVHEAGTEGCGGGYSGGYSDSKGSQEDLSNTHFNAKVSRERSKPARP